MQPRTWNGGILAAKLLLLASLLYPWASAEEPAPDVKLFALPKPELRTETPAESSGSAPSIRSEESRAAEEVEELSISSELSTISTELSIGTFESMSGTPVLSRIEFVEPPGGALGWLNESIWEPVFSPEVVKLGKIQMSGGIVAAIKRKNPFCLLHPLAFIASW
ncbi:MAG TPA: hypothetical protein VF773_07160 [Verrucomicrobiae bacterium]